MANTLIYTIPLADSDQGSVSSRQAKNVSAISTLTSDFGSVEGTGSQPGTRPIRGAIKNLYSDLLVKELEELAQAPNYGQVALFTDDNDPKNDGYVTVKSFDVNPADPQTQKLWEYNGSLTFNGTRESHWRSVETAPTSIDNPFSTGGSDSIGIPASATKVRWYDEQGQTAESATVQSTSGGRFIDTDRYDPAEPSFSDPTLICKIPYSDEGKMDARVWDDRGDSRLDANGNNQWQKVFATGHNYRGDSVVENGLLRLFLDEDGESLTFEEWDDTNQVYSSVSLGASDWVLADFNHTRISPSRVGGQARFRNTVNGSTHTLNYQVNRSSNRVLFITPPNESSIPSGLQTKLDPIAETWGDESQPIQGVLARSEVNQ